MRIAQVAPLFESLPPRLHGGAARAISYLTEELCDLGHRVTLFASGDSITRAELVPGSSRALARGESADSARRLHAALLEQVYARRDEFDVVHFHLEDWHLLAPRLLDATSHLTTVHGRTDLDGCAAHWSDPRLRLIAISEAQRAALPDGPWIESVGHGIPEGLCRPCHELGSHLVFVGRIAPHAGVEAALEIARRARMPLKIAARIEQRDYAYYLTLRPQLRQPGVEFLGEIDEREKDWLLAGAYALLYATSVPEPFGLSMVEALHCGTPVIAVHEGVSAEVVDEGVTGFVVDSLDGALDALTHVPELDRRRIAAIARQRFSARRMARDYLRLYARSISWDLATARPASRALRRVGAARSGSSARI